MNVKSGTVYRLALRAACDPRTVKKMLRGGVVRGLPGLRLRAVLLQEGYLP